ncbi:hypothetical protein CCR75_006255 [Bremia lactucae]|uniref:Transglutaminase elicitor n=1 Tax=Bremia lactucae TaxID=4779 RepID=A0A976IFG1_BRELC|nr:hypothetical protein CCR75_006255 [Bremia lactucae]
MVYSPSLYLVSAALATVMLKMQEASAGSMFYGAHTISNTTEVIDKSFPGNGREVDEIDRKIVVTIDSTLPDITTISTVVVQHPELLSNVTVPPIEPISTLVGRSVLAQPPVSPDANPDAYVSKTPPLVVSGEKKEDPKDCATGWKEHVPSVKKGILNNVMQNHTIVRDRRLAAYDNIDIRKLEEFFGPLVLKWVELPTIGVAASAPWPGPYWPDYQDSINVIWNQGDISASQKYATAFGHDPGTFMSQISKFHGIESEIITSPCKHHKDCDSTKSLTACAIREGSEEGKCIETWLGICHAWSAAATVESEPNCDVHYNNQTFHALDIKGLLSVLYADTMVRAIFTGVRYKHGKKDLDEYGRAHDPILRDLNPGFFHITICNLLGIFQKSFVVDISADEEVWNQPVRGYEIAEQTEMTPQEAARTFYGLEEYPWNAEAKRIVYVQTRLTWVLESYDDGSLVESGRVDNYTTGEWYYYLLELDEFGTIIGGEWLYHSCTNHPDFLWLVAATPQENARSRAGIKYDEVKMLLTKSVECSARE